MTVKFYYGAPLRDHITNDIKAPMHEILRDMKVGFTLLTAGRAIYHLLLVGYRVLRLPEPTRERVHKANSITILDLRDEFFAWEDNPGRTNLFRFAFKCWIMMNEDSYYGDRMDWLAERIAYYYNIGKWEKRRPNKPRMTHWREFDESRALHQAQKKARNTMKRVAQFMGDAIVDKEQLQKELEENQAFREALRSAKTSEKLIQLMSDHETNKSNSKGGIKCLNS